jgi:hypothetical protein
VGQVPDLPNPAPAALGRSGTCPTAAHVASTSIRKHPVISGGQSLETASTKSRLEKWAGTGIYATAIAVVNGVDELQDVAPRPPTQPLTV